MKYIISAFADEASADFSEQLRICGENTVKWIEVRGVNGKNISDLTIDEVRAAKKQADEGGFRFSSIGSPFGKIGVTDDFALHLEKFKRVIEYANILDARYIRIFSFYIPEGESYPAYEEEVFKRLSVFLDNANGVTLCHENEKGIYGDNAERCHSIFDNFGGKIKLIFDPANFIQCGVDVAKAYELLFDGIEYFHIKDCISKTGTVVPAGYGDGGIERLINDFYGRNNSNDKMTFLSVEPHLKVFEGYSSLEAGRNGLGNGEFVFESNERAFSAAVLALKAILCANAFIQAKDIERGYGEWKR